MPKITYKPLSNCGIYSYWLHYVYSCFLWFKRQSIQVISPCSRSNVTLWFGNKVMCNLQNSRHLIIESFLRLFSELWLSIVIESNISTKFDDIFRQIWYLYDKAVTQKEANIQADYISILFYFRCLVPRNVYNNQNFEFHFFKFAIQRI